MKSIRKRTAALALAAILGLSPLASASEALGHEIHGASVDLSVGTALTKQIFWSDTYSDLRTERYFTYTPNQNVTPVVSYGEKITSRATLSAMAKVLENQGKRLVGGMNGDLYVMATGTPLGLVVTDGILRSAPSSRDQLYCGVGFRSDGTAFIGKPNLAVTATFRGQTFAIGGGVNKIRTELGGYTLYTEDFNATTQNTSAGVDVILTPVLDNVGQPVNVDLDVSRQGQNQIPPSSGSDEVTSSDNLTAPPTATGSPTPIQEVKGTLTQSAQLAIGSRVTCKVEQVLNSTGSIAIPAGKMVLSINGKGDSYLLSNLSSLQPGETVDIDVTAPEAAWSQANQAMGGLYKLVTAGVVESSLPSERTAYSAVGVKADGTAIFYTIDGKQPGYSVGATLTQVAKRLIELGCVDAISLDGGGSTTIGATYPDGSSLGVINKPSDGSQRANSVALFLATALKPTGTLNSLYLTPGDSLLLSGAKVQVTAMPMDTAYYTMTTAIQPTWSVQNGGGSVDTSGVFTAGGERGVAQITAASGSASGSAVMTVIKTPDSISLSNETSGAAVTALNLDPGAAVDLKASAVYKKLALTAQDNCFTWSLDPAVGTVDANGLIKAGEKTASGSLTVSAGGTVVTIPVSVAGRVKTLEEFETGVSSMGSTDSMKAAAETAADRVKFGRGSLRADYNAASGGTASLTTTLAIPAGDRYLNLWVYADGSGNSLTATIANAQGAASEVILTGLDDTGWKYVSVKLPDGAAALRSLNLIFGGSGNPSGTLWFDQFTTSNEALQDTVSPAVTLTLNGGISARITDNLDKSLDKSRISLTRDGKALDFTWDAASGTLKAALPAGDTSIHHILVTAADSSGNLGRAEGTQARAQAAAPTFTDLSGHWSADYADYLYSRSITNGVPNDTDTTLQFQPDRTITRGEFFAMTARWLGVDMGKYAGVTLPFADAAQIPDWALPGVRTMYALGYLKGSMDAQGHLVANAGATISRAEAMTLLSRTQAGGYSPAALTFTDAALVPSWALPAVQSLVGQNVVSGYNNQIMPANPVSRGEVAKLLFSMT